MNLNTLFPITTKFRATNLWKSFLLNALASAFIASVASEIRFRLGNEKDSLYILLNSWTPGKQLSEDVLYAFTFFVSFVACILVYNVLYLLFLFGGGMLTSNKLPSYF
jgi:hypothetical protein